ncbi:MAG: hypothetical protein QXO72_01965, partial [Sulfolobales archaeon]
EVYDLLSKNIPEVVSEEMTREVEGLLEAVRNNLLSRDEALTLLLSDVINIRLRSAALLGGLAGSEDGSEAVST